MGGRGDAWVKASCFQSSVWERLFLLFLMPKELALVENHPGGALSALLSVKPSGVIGAASRARIPAGLELGAQFPLSRWSRWADSCARRSGLFFPPALPSDSRHEAPSPATGFPWAPHAVPRAGHGAGSLREHP